MSSFPIITVTRPRQSKKTNLLRIMLPDWAYINLEDPDNLDQALKLVSYIQLEVDQDRCPGRFALTGSHTLLMLEHVSQSLAGRTGFIQK